MMAESMKVGKELTAAIRVNPEFAKVASAMVLHTKKTHIRWQVNPSWWSNRMSVPMTQWQPCLGVLCNTLSSATV